MRWRDDDGEEEIIPSIVILSSSASHHYFLFQTIAPSVRIDYDSTVSWIRSTSNTKIRTGIHTNRIRTNNTMTTTAASAPQEASLFQQDEPPQEVDELMMMEDMPLPFPATEGDNDNHDDDMAMMTEDDDMMQAFLDEGAVAELDATASAVNLGARQVSDSTHGTHPAAATTAATGTLEPVVSPSPPPATAAATVSHTEDPLVITGRPGIPLYLSCNPDHLSEYQCLIRKNIELFEATESDIQARIKGRNKPIVLGQVGIRCIHCRHVVPQERERGSMYYPHSLVGVYQAAQILSQQHLLETCPYVPANVRQDLTTLRTKKSPANHPTAGKEYWAATAQVLGVFEDQYGLRFEERLGIVRGHVEPH